MADSRTRRWVTIGLAVVVGLPLLAAAVGSLLPRDHVARMTIDLQAPPDRVWAVISDVGGAARWRTDVTAVRLEAASGGPLRFVETSSNGETPFEVVAQDAPRRQVVRVVDDGLPFGGTWTWDLQPQGPGTHLSIEEAGFIRNPIFRLMGTVFFSPTDTMEAYLRALAKELGERAEPRRSAQR